MAIIPWPINNMANGEAGPLFRENQFKPYFYGGKIFAVCITGNNRTSSHSIQIYVSRDEGYTWRGIVEFPASRYIYTVSGTNVYWSHLYDTAASGLSLYIAYYALDDKLTTRRFDMNSENLENPHTASTVDCKNADAFQNIRLFLLPDLSSVIATGVTTTAGWGGFYNDFRERYITNTNFTGAAWSAVNVIPFDYSAGAVVPKGDLFCIGAGKRLHSLRLSALGVFQHNSVDLATGTAGTAQPVGDGTAYTANIMPCPVDIGGQTNILIVTGEPSGKQWSFHGVSQAVMSFTQQDAPFLAANQDFRKQVAMGSYVESLCYTSDLKGIQSYRFNGTWSGPFPVYSGAPQSIESVGAQLQGGNLEMIAFWGDIYWYLGREREPADWSLANFAY